MAKGAFVVTAIEAKRFDYGAIEKAIDKAMDKEGAEIVSRMERTVATWKNKPAFQVRKVKSRGKATISLSVYPKGNDKPAQVWGMLDRGTRPHIIRPRGPWALKFRWGGPGSYQAKTRPNWIGSQAGGATGDIVRAGEVHHPGTEARNWSKIISQEYKSTFFVRVRLAIGTAIQKMMGL